MKLMNVSYFILALHLAGCSGADMVSDDAAMAKNNKSGKCVPTQSKPCKDKTNMEGGDPNNSSSLVNDALDIKDGGASLLVPPEFLLSPALAVRKSNCIMCHGTVTGDVITDFNVNAEAFATRSASGTPSEITHKLLIENVSGMRPRNWLTTNLKGKLVVPDVEVVGAIKGRFDNPPALFKIATALQQPISDISAAELSETNQVRRPIVAVGVNRNQSLPGVDQIKSYKTVKISPPTESEITALLSRAGARDVGGSPNIKILALDSESSITGLTAKKGATGQWFAINSGASISCKGDIVIGGTLVLKDVSDFSVGARGCRLYVEKSIFVKGSLESKGDANYGIQLGAGRAILLGISHNRSINAEVTSERNNVVAEIQDAGPTWIMKKGTGILASTNYSADQFPQGLNSLLIANGGHWNYAPGAAHPAAGAKCKFPGDPGQPGTNNGGDCVLQAPPTESRQSAKYTGVLFAAPTVSGRYFGAIKGVIIADFALVALKHLDFTSDMRFDKAPALPKLGRELITISN